MNIDYEKPILGNFKGNDLHLLECVNDTYRRIAEYRNCIGLEEPNEFYENWSVVGECGSNQLIIRRKGDGAILYSKIVPDSGGLRERVDFVLQTQRELRAADHLDLDPDVFCFCFARYSKASGFQRFRKRDFFQFISSNFALGSIADGSWLFWMHGDRLAEHRLAHNKYMVLGYSTDSPACFLADYSEKGNDMRIAILDGPVIRMSRNFTHRILERTVSLPEFRFTSWEIEVRNKQLVEDGLRIERESADLTPTTPEFDYGRPIEIFSWVTNTDKCSLAAVKLTWSGVSADMPKVQVLWSRCFLDDSKRPAIEIRVSRMGQWLLAQVTYIGGWSKPTCEIIDYWTGNVRWSTSGHYMRLANPRYACGVSFGAGLLVLDLETLTEQVEDVSLAGMISLMVVAHRFTRGVAFNLDATGLPRPIQSVIANYVRRPVRDGCFMNQHGASLAWQRMKTFNVALFPGVYASSL